jgi:hypothetical protein
MLEGRQDGEADSSFCAENSELFRVVTDMIRTSN